MFDACAFTSAVYSAAAAAAAARYELFDYKCIELETAQTHIPHRQHTCMLKPNAMRNVEHLHTRNNASTATKTTATTCVFIVCLVAVANVRTYDDHVCVLERGLFCCCYCEYG